MKYVYLHYKYEQTMNHWFARVNLFFSFMVLITIIPCLSSAVSMSDEGIYQATKSACIKISPHDVTKGSLSLASIRLGINLSSDFKSMLSYIRSDSLEQVVSSLNVDQNKWIKYIINNPGFQQALSECYPDNEFMQNFFKNLVISADRTGKILGSYLTFFSLYILRQAPEKLSAILNLSSKAFNKWASYLGITSLLTSDTKFTSMLEKMLTENGMSKILENGQKSNNAILELTINLRNKLNELEVKINSCNQCGEFDDIKADYELTKILLSGSESAISSTTLTHD